MRRFCAFSLAVAATAVLASEAGAQQYSFTVFSDPWDGNTIVTGINDNGDIVGNVVYSEGGNTQFGFVYSNNAFTKIEAPGAANTQVKAISNSGKVVGNYTHYETFREFDSYGFLYDNGSFHDVNVPNPKNAGTFPADINGSGTVAGWYDWGVEDFFGFKYDGSNYNDIYAGWETFVTGITGNGEVVGYYQSEVDRNYGFIHDGAGIRDFTYPGAYDTYIDGVSESGMMVGKYTIPIYDATYDPAYPGSPDMIASGGNFLWDGSDFQMIDFPGTLADVNSSGWIVGSAKGNSGRSVGILGIPIGNNSLNRSAAVPEPATMLLLVGAIAGIFGARRRLAAF